MFSAISLLVLACAITIINAQGPVQCSEAKIGNVPTSHPVILEAVIIHNDNEIHIPSIPECVKGVSGVTALMCSSNTAPKGYFTNFNTLLINPVDLSSYTTVTVTVYCKV